MCASAVSLVCLCLCKPCRLVLYACINFVFACSGCLRSNYICAITYFLWMYACMYIAMYVSMYVFTFMYMCGMYWTDLNLYWNICIIRIYSKFLYFSAVHVCVSGFVNLDRESSLFYMLAFIRIDRQTKRKRLTDWLTDRQITGRQSDAQTRGQADA